MANDESQTPTLGQVIKRLISERLDGLRVMLPGRVESYDQAALRVSVQPLIQHGFIDPETGNRVVERLPVVTDVPIVFPGSGGVRVRFPINRGDTVMLVFSSSSLDRWLVSGREVDPSDDRRHHLTDAIAVPGLLSFPEAKDASTMIEFTADDQILCGGTNPLVTKAEFAAHVHGTPSGGGPSTSPTDPISGTAKLRG